MITALPLAALSLVSLTSAHPNGKCPFGHDEMVRTNEIIRPVLTDRRLGQKFVDYEAVKTELWTLMTDSKESWPADYGHYGPLMVRLAWHNAGSYRISDGRGGSDGARQRFEPERSWADNTNLDKARSLLWPIKEKFGNGLSWGDLIVLAGNVAIESMGGPVLGFCGGRIDDHDGSESILLGPTNEQEDYIPCEVNGQCDSPLGSTTIGLIYVNPEGPMGKPFPDQSVPEIRDTFARMGMNDMETVALIGGGHTFGKAHGACLAGAGPSPAEDPLNPWPGLCGSGVGAETFTSGFELPFTSRPLYWDNEYFVNLLNFEWEVFQGPGGHNQWAVRNGTGPKAPSVDILSNEKIPVGLLTTDVALLHDPSYLSISETFAQDLLSFDEAFMHAWYKLTTRDMGPVTRCLGDDIPNTQTWQNPLSSPKNTYDIDAVKAEITQALRNDPLAEGHLSRLAWRCSATFRASDYLGGCNGARVRFDPQSSWPVNKGNFIALQMLSPIIDQFEGEGLSWSDLIILAGNTALEYAGGNPLSFCPGRSDAIADEGASSYLEPKVTGNINNSLADLKDFINLKGLTLKEFTVLNAAGYAVGDNACDEGFFCGRGAWNSSPGHLTNRFFTDLLSNNWERAMHPSTGRDVFKAIGKDLYMWATDMMFKTDPEFRVLAEEYDVDNNLFLTDLSLAWTKISNIDRFDGPTGNICYNG